MHSIRSQWAECQFYINCECVIHGDGRVFSLLLKILTAVSLPPLCPLFSVDSIISRFSNGEQVSAVSALLIPGAVMTVSLRGVAFKCTQSQLLPDGTCPVNTGIDVLKLYDFNMSTMTYVLGMVMCLIMYRILTYGILRLKLMHWQLSFDLQE